MKKINRTSFWLPNYIADSVFELDVKTLKKIGITHLVFDLDDTLITGHVQKLTSETVAHIASLKRAGFTILLGSNTRRDISAIVDSIHAHHIRSQGLIFKPRKNFYRQVIQEANVSPEHVAMVGDHPINDVLGPNRIGFTTILIKSLNGKTYSFNSWFINLVLKQVG